MRVIAALAPLLMALAASPVAAATATPEPSPAGRHPHVAAKTPPAPAPVVPDAPPAAPVIPPPDAAPPHPSTPPPPPVVHDDAPGEARPITDGLRLTFGGGRSDFNPTVETALKTLAGTGRGNTGKVYTVYAYAPGSAEDTSTPRRLSLERGLAVRSALINAGIPSTRIYVHAMGASGRSEGGPADRADVRCVDQNAPPPASVVPK